MIWLVIIIVAIVGYLLASIYRHDDSIFSKQTGYSFLDVIFNKEAKAAYKLYSALIQSSEADKLLLNVSIPEGNSKHTVDAIFIHESGIFIIDILHKQGWIAGREYDSEWLNLLHKDKTVIFDNPVNDTKRAILALRSVLPEINSDLYSSIILFTDSCAFQKIELQSIQVEVLKTNDLKKWRASLAGELLTEPQIASIYAALKPYAAQKQTVTKKQPKLA